MSTVYPPTDATWLSRQKRRVFRRNGWRCVSCGTQDNLTLDHIVPKAKGGTDATANLQTMCRPCNNAKGDQMPGSLLAGQL